MEKKVKKVIGCLSLLISLVFLMYVMAWKIAPGSYPKAEIYEFAISEDSLLLIIDEWKKENPTYNIKEVAILDHKNKHWNYRYFYYPDKDLKLMTYVRRSSTEPNVTHFAFVSISSGLSWGNWTDVNESFWWWNNSSEKEEFERRILNPIRKKIEN